MPTKEFRTTLMTLKITAKPLPSSVPTMICPSVPLIIAMTHPLRILNFPSSSVGGGPGGIFMPGRPPRGMTMAANGLQKKHCLLKRRAGVEEQSQGGNLEN